MKSISALVIICSFSIGAIASENCEYLSSPGKLELAVKSGEAVTLVKRTYNAENVVNIQGTRVLQILKMAEQTIGSTNQSVAEVLPSFNKGEIFRYDFTSNVRLPASFYTVIFGYVGDTEVGAIFEGASDNMVAEMADKGLKICSEKYRNWSIDFR